MWVAFDVLGTLFDVTALDREFEQAGLPAVRGEWIERLLGSSRSLTLTGHYEPFDSLAAGTLRTTLAVHGADTGDAESIAARLSELPAYPDASAAVDEAAARGLGVAVLTNGGKDSTAKLLESAGLADRVEHVFSVEEVGAYKPDPRPYRAAADALEGNVTLVAAHAWDVLGAVNAGLDAVWVDRLEREWPFETTAGVRAGDLVEAVRAI